MFRRCSAPSRYARFLAPLPTVPPAHLAQLLDPDGPGDAWVGVTRDDPETVLAVGSWSRSGREDAELALIVEDPWQRRGIGSRLLWLLAERAWNAGACRLSASVLTESRHVFRMLRGVLGPISTRPDGHVSQVTVDHCSS